MAVYLAYTIYEADYDLQRAGSFYGDLGVPLTASEREIKSRFRRLAALHHPDKVIVGGSGSGAGGGEEAAAAVNAYFVHLKTATDTLLDPARRFAYDRFGPDIVGWAAGSPRLRCVTVYDFVARGLRTLLPYYGAAAAGLYLLGLLGYLSPRGSYERWLVVACVLVFELHAVSRPVHPRFLTHLVNPALALLAPGHGAFLPFQAVLLARKLSVTIFIGLSRIAPLLGADTRSGQIVAADAANAVNGASASGADDPALLAALDRLEAAGRSLDADAARLLEMEMAPFVGQEAVLTNMRAKIKQWLVQNTIRADPMVRDAVGRSLQRRRADAPAGARGTR